MSRERERKRGQRGRVSLFLGGLVLLGLVGGSIAAAQEEEPTKEALKALVDAACNWNDWQGSQRAFKEISRLGPKAAPVLPELVGNYLHSPTYPLSDMIIGIGEPAAAYLIREIEKRSDQEFSEALKLLRDMGPKAIVAVPDLVRFLRRPGRDAREGILETLAAIGPGAREALPAVLDTLDLDLRDDRDWLVQEAATCALAVFGPAAIPPLLERLAGGDPTSRARAARVLETMGPGAWTAVLVLREALGDQDPLVRVQAARALVAVDDDLERALPVVLAAFPSLVNEHYGLVEWLDRLGPRAVPAVPTLIPLLDGPLPVRTVTLRALAKIGPEANAAAPALAAAIEKDPNDIEAAVALWSVDRRHEALQLLLRKLEGEDNSLVGTVEFLLGNPSFPPASLETLPVLVGLLSRGKSLRIVIPFLAYMGPAAKEAIPEIEYLLWLLSKPLTNLREYPNPISIRLTAADCLWRIGGDARRVLPALIDVLDWKGMWDHKERGLFSDPEVFVGKSHWASPWDVSRAAWFLGEMGPAAKEAAPLLHQALSAANRSIRTSAADALWKIEGDAQATVRELLQISAEEFPPFSRSGSFGLGGTWAEGRGDPLAEAGAQAVSLLIEALKRPEPQVRARAAEALGAGGPAASEVLPALSRVARDPDVRVASAAIRALRQLGPEGRKAIERALPSAEMLPPRKRK